MRLVLLGLPAALLMSSARGRDDTPFVIKAPLAVAPDQFLDFFVLSMNFTQSLFDLHGDEHVRIGAWATANSIAGHQKSAQREIMYLHPVKSKYPGMPSHARTIKSQRYNLCRKTGGLNLLEEMQFKDIPYADYFRVQSAWTVVPVQEPSGEQASQLTVEVSVLFDKKTMLKGQIRRSTYAEQGEALRDWIVAANARVTTLYGSDDQITSEKRNDSCRKDKIDWARVILGRRFRGRRAIR